MSLTRSTLCTSRSSQGQFFKMTPPNPKVLDENNPAIPVLGSNRKRMFEAFQSPRGYCQPFANMLQLPHTVEVITTIHRCACDTGAIGWCVNFGEGSVRFEPIDFLATTDVSLDGEQMLFESDRLGVAFVPLRVVGQHMIMEVWIKLFDRSLLDFNLLASALRKGKSIFTVKHGSIHCRKS